MVTADTAATVAIRHGLTLLDAAGIRYLADDEAEAEHVATLFAEAQTPEAA